MNIIEATKSYEAWLGKQITLLPEDIERKHAAMAAGLFPFLRATFFRWMQLWPEVCGAERRTTKILAVGDLHVENFGTWRDREGRLAWGINDFDEAFTLPYTVDLIRLAASAHIAIREEKLKVGPQDACTAILNGYLKGLQTGGCPFVLAEDHRWLRSTVTSALRDPSEFWAKLDALPTWRGRVPKSARRCLERMFPDPKLEYRIVHRISGLGSLGRERYVAIAAYHGARVAREAKAVAASACLWASGLKKPQRSLYEDLLERSVRAIDPFVHLKGRWIVRRLAPDCSRVELSAMPQERDEIKLLHAMGFETANVHLATPRAKASIVRDLSRRPRHWLHASAVQMVTRVIHDFEDWRAEAARPRRGSPASKHF